MKPHQSKLYHSIVEMANSANDVLKECGSEKSVEIKTVDSKVFILVKDTSKTKPTEDSELLKEAKQKYNETKKNAKPDACGHCGKMNGEGVCKMMVCGKCRVVAYCSKECQIKAWKEHKHVCKEMFLKRTIEQQLDLAHVSKQYVGRIPRRVLLLSPSVTGYDKDVAVEVCPWEYDTAMMERATGGLLTLDSSNVVKVVKQFFKTERLQGSAFHHDEIGNMILDCLTLFGCDYPGIREALPWEMERQNFADSYASIARVPKGYRFDASECATHLSPEQIEICNKAIEDMRKDLGESTDEDNYFVKGEEWKPRR